MSVFCCILAFLCLHVNSVKNIICDGINECQDKMLSCENTDLCHILCLNWACNGLVLSTNNVNGVNITCYEEYGCSNLELKIQLTSHKPLFEMHCVDPYSCAYTRGLITTNNDSNSVISNIDSNINCYTDNSCFDASFVVTGIDKVELNCNGKESCKWAGITLRSWNNDPIYNELNVNCYNGMFVCQAMSINGLLTSKVNVTCYSNNFDNECFDLQVYCPVNPFNNDNNYTMSNIDNNSCLIDFGDAGYGSIHAIYGIAQMKYKNSHIETELICDFDWFNQKTSCDDHESIETNIIPKAISHKVNLKLSNPNSQEISCIDNNKDCSMYVFEQKNSVNSVVCPNGDYWCSVICYRYALSNAIIEGTNSQALRVISVSGADNSTKNSTINCPIGNNSECNIVARAWRAYEFSVINADNTEQLTIDGNGWEALSDTIINARNTTLVSIDCGDHGCQGLKLYMYDDNIVQGQDIFNSRLTVVCGGINSCVNFKIIIESYFKEYFCVSIGDINQWFCNEKIIRTLYPTGIPSESPTNNPTIVPSFEPTIEPTPNPERIEGTKSRNFLTKFLRSLPPYAPWLIGGFAGFLLLIGCLFICICIKSRQLNRIIKANQLKTGSTFTEVSMSPKCKNGLTIVYADSNNIHYNENNARSIPADIEGNNNENGTESSDNNVYNDDDNDDDNETSDDDNNDTTDDDNNNNGPGAIIPSHSNHIKHPSDSAEQLYKKQPTRGSTHKDATIMDVIRENNEMDTGKHGEVSPTMMSMMSIGSIQI